MFIYLIQEKVLKSENNDFPASAALPDSPRNKTPSKWYQSESDSRPFKMIGFILIIFS